MQRSTRRARSFGLPIALLLGAAGPILAHAAHPFISDDTGTQGAGHWQFELNTDRTRSTPGGVSTRSQVVNATLTYGAIDTLDLAVNAPYQSNTVSGQPTVQGGGDMTVEAKWRSYENDEEGWSVALKPIVTLPTGNESRGLGAGRGTASMGLLGQYQKDSWTWLINGSATFNDNNVGNRKGLWNASTALLYAPNEQWTLGVDVGISRDPDTTSNGNLSYAVLGVQYHISQNVDADVGYRRNLGSGTPANTLGAGLTVRW